MNVPPPPRNETDPPDALGLSDLLASWGAAEDGTDAVIYRVIDGQVRSVRESVRQARDALETLAASSGASLAGEMGTRLRALIEEGGDSERTLAGDFPRRAEEFLKELGPSLRSACDGAMRALRGALLRAGTLAPAEDRRASLELLWRTENLEDWTQGGALLGELEAARRLAEAWPESWSRELRSHLDRIAVAAPDAARRTRSALDTGRPDALASALRELRRMLERGLLPPAATAALASSRERVARALQGAGEPDRGVLAHVIEEARAAIDTRLDGIDGARALETWRACLDAALALPEGTEELDARIVDLRGLACPDTAFCPLEAEANSLEDLLKRLADDLPLSLIARTRAGVDAARATSGASDAEIIEAARLALASDALRVEAHAARVRESRLARGRDERATLEGTLQALEALGDPAIDATTAGARRKLEGQDDRLSSSLAKELRDSLAPAGRRLGSLAARSAAAARAGIEGGNQALRAPLDALISAARSGHAEALARAVVELRGAGGGDSPRGVPRWTWAIACLPLLALPLVALTGTRPARPETIVVASAAPLTTALSVELVAASGQSVSLELTPDDPEARAELLSGRYSVISDGTFTGVTFAVPGRERVELPAPSAGGP